MVNFLGAGCIVYNKMNLCNHNF